jgi:O-antigen ligase
VTGTATVRGPFAAPNAWWPVALIPAIALLAGLTAGDPAPHWAIPLGALVLLWALYAGVRWPFNSLRVLLGSTILLVVCRVSGLRSATPFDVLLPSLFVATWFDRARHGATTMAADTPERAALLQAERRFVRAVQVFFAAAALSLLQIGILSGWGSAGDSGLMLFRALQGVILYPLCRHWLRDHARIGQAWSALFVAGIALVAVNLLGVLAWQVPRAGMTFFVNNWDAPLASPNEAGAAVLIVGVVLMVREAMRPDARNLALGVLLVLMLALTQSRSALLAWGTFGLFALRGVKPSRLVAGVLGTAMLLPLLPSSFWTRMMRTVVVEKGSFEAFSFFQRVYGWQTAWKVFLDHPITGVGYLGYRFVSSRYNELRIVFGTVENYYYEILVSMGVVGLALLVWATIELYRLGRDVGRLAPKGSLAHHMARFHTPLVTALLVANMTGDNLVGTVSLAQLAMWTAVMVRAGHDALGARA